MAKGVVEEVLDLVFDAESKNGDDDAFVRAADGFKAGLGIGATTKVDFARRFSRMLRVKCTQNTHGNVPARNTASKKGVTSDAASGILINGTPANVS